MEKRIQIPLSLYESMVEYIQDHYDAYDHTRYYKIIAGIERKKNADIRHNLYSAYKAQQDPEIREQLRTAYLDEAGVTGRWPESVEENYRNGNFIL